MSDTKSIRELVEEEFKKFDDKSVFKDKKVKKQFFEDLQKKHTSVKRASLEATFSTLLKSHCKENNIDFNEFSSKPQKRFSSKLDLSTSGKPVDVEDAKPETKTGVKIQNPNAKKLDDSGNKVDEYPLEAVAGSFNSLLKAVVPNMDDLTEQEREDASKCLNMALGNVLENSAKMRALFGGMGLAGMYGGKIAKARREGKELQKQMDKEKRENRELPEVSEEEQKKFAEAQEQFLKEQKMLYESKKAQV